MKLLCRQVMEQLFGRGINWDKVGKLTTCERLHFELRDIKAMIAALHFILLNSAKYNCDEKILLLELQQLGLPKDICNTICRSSRANKDTLRVHLTNNVLQVPRIDDIKWRVDYLQSSRDLANVNSNSIRLAFKGDKIEMSADKFRILYSGILSI